MKKNLKIGLFGFGCVGLGLYKLLKQSKNTNLEIKKIVIKNGDKPRILKSSIFSTAPCDVFDDPEIDIVVELIDDAVVAFDILKQSLQRRKPVVTANKKMLAENLEEILELQKKYNTQVLYEGAVCGSIPVIRNLETYYGNTEIKSIEGIFNGTTNFILSKMFNERIGYPDALNQAQRSGFAETEPSLDVKGYDARFKLSILIVHAFGIFIEPEKIPVIGIEQINEFDRRFAQNKKCTIKLIARAWKANNQIFAWVAPQFVLDTNILSAAKNEDNAVIIEGILSVKQAFFGKGAGSYPTASAILSDLSALSCGYRYEYPKLVWQKSYTPATLDDIMAFIRVDNETDIIEKHFRNSSSGYANGQWHSFTGSISFKQLLALSREGNNGIVLQEQTQQV